MIPIKYAYLVGTIVFFIPWLILFLMRKDLRREMLIGSVSIAIVSFLTSLFLFTVDWWHPETITGTRVGIEDLLLGFNFYISARRDSPALRLTSFVKS